MKINKAAILAMTMACLAASPLKADPNWIPTENLKKVAAAGEAMRASAKGWTILFAGSDLDAWNKEGDANWKLMEGAVQADAGGGMLVTKESFRNFELKLEFWADKGSNSGVFMRCSNPQTINDSNCYEANIFDSRPDQSGRTGAITNIAPPRVAIDSEDHWNTYEILADGAHLVVKLNGVVTVDIHNEKLKEGPLALQFAKGGIKFKNVMLRRLPEANNPEKRLADLGIKLIYPAAPPANYLKAVRAGNLLYLAGHLPQKEDGSLITGKLGKDLSVEQGRLAAEFAAINLISTLKKEVGDLKKVTKIVKVLGMVNAADSFEDHPKVVNGASDLLVAAFGGPVGKHARAAVGMSSLPFNVAVEVEMIVEVEP